MPTNKFNLNTRKLLNPRIQEENTIEIEEYSSEGDTQYKKIDGMLSQDLESIEENIKSIPDVLVRKFADEGKGIISELSEEMSKKHSGKEKDMEYM